MTTLKAKSKPISRRKSQNQNSFSPTKPPQLSDQFSKSPKKFTKAKLKKALEVYREFSKHPIRQFPFFKNRTQIESLEKLPRIGRRDVINPFIPDGSRYGHLTVRDYVGLNRHLKRMYRCECDCGSLAVITAGNLKSGVTNRCFHCSRLKSIRIASRHQYGPDYYRRRVRLIETMMNLSGEMTRVEIGKCLGLPERTVSAILHSHRIPGYLAVGRGQRTKDRVLPWKVYWPFKQSFKIYPFRQYPDPR